MQTLINDATPVFPEVESVDRFGVANRRCYVHCGDSCQTRLRQVSLASCEPLCERDFYAETSLNCITKKSPV